SLDPYLGQVEVGQYLLEALVADVGVFNFLIYFTLERLVVAVSCLGPDIRLIEVFCDCVEVMVNSLANLDDLPDFDSAAPHKSLATACRLLKFDQWELGFTK